MRTVTDGAFVSADDQAGCTATPVFIPARPLSLAEPASFPERVQRRVIRWFRLARLLDAAVSISTSSGASWPGA
jgi:hypothetical protein